MQGSHVEGYDCSVMRSMDEEVEVLSTERACFMQPGFEGDVVMIQCSRLSIEVGCGGR